MNGPDETRNPEGAPGGPGGDPERSGSGGGGGEGPAAAPGPALGGTVVPRDEAGPEGRRMTVAEHLEELRSRVIRSLLYLAGALVLCLIFNDYIMGAILRQPYLVLKELGYRTPRLQYLGPSEGFITWLKLALVASLVIASPLMAREIWGFIAAGLYPHEKRWIRIFAPLSYLLFLGGVAFLYFLVMPTALRFLFDFGTRPHLFGIETADRVIEYVPQVSRYLSLYIVMSVIMGIVFQLPLIMLFFISTGIISTAFFRKYRRHFIVGSVAVLAVLTPTGDAATLVLVSLPVVLLYEGGILLGRLATRGRKAA